VADDCKRGTRDWSAARVSLKLVWRNPLFNVAACLQAREKNDPYCLWAEQANKIYVRRFNWETDNNWFE
jgi:hypothetical protein